MPGLLHRLLNQACTCAITLDDFQIESIQSEFDRGTVW